MITPSAANIEKAMRMLALEGATGDSAEEYAAGAERVYDKLAARLSLLLTSAGVQALFLRSANLTQRRVTCLDKFIILENSTNLRECLQGLEPAAAMEAASTLFGIFLDLIASFIGERLTTEVLRSAWPAIDSVLKETKK